ncbi:preprotein translocase subunit SecG [uncultured Paracoccus sp.]|uniref:preprotein translocase subunit SecG n=1 Tax=uncultured Paracoccus sp. TaxID=189685 RepID=UPI0025E4FCA3|nr:preprotein translocase subunit SecG [uncultured Paracoccus sp.]
MENVILTVHLILAVMLAGVVLLQRSEGGGLGMGGGGGAGGGVMSGRQAANVLTRVTWILGVAIFATSIALTILAARQANNSSIMDQFGGQAPTEAPATGLPGLPAYTPPPSTAGNPLTPPSPDAATDAPATDAPATDADVTPAPAAQTPAEAPATAPADALTPPAPDAQAPAATAPAAAPDAAAEPATPDTAPAPAN